MGISLLIANCLTMKLFSEDNINVPHYIYFAFYLKTNLITGSSPLSIAKSITDGSATEPTVTHFRPHCVKYARIRVFSDPYFLVLPTILSLDGKMRVGESPYSGIFYALPVSHFIQKPAMWFAVTMLLQKLESRQKFVIYPCSPI